MTRITLSDETLIKLTKLNFNQNTTTFEEMISNLLSKTKERELDEVDEREREKLIVQGMKLIVYGLKSWRIGKERERVVTSKEDNKI